MSGLGFGAADGHRDGWGGGIAVGAGRVCLPRDIYLAIRQIANNKYINYLPQISQENGQHRFRWNRNPVYIIKTY